MKVEKLLNFISKAYLDILKENLVGIYVHGSLAFGCFTWKKSDIDFVVVVHSSLKLKEKMSLIQVLYELEEDGPEKGFEMSVVLLKDCQNFCYPTPFELHYSKYHQAKAKEDLEQYCKEMYGSDEDLAAHFMVIRCKGICQWGKPISEVFSEIPKAYYWKSILHDLEDAIELIMQNPMYAILNLCRAVAYWEQDMILSKKEGGEWALKNMPRLYNSLLQEAILEYQDKENPIYQEEQCLSFVAYVQQRLSLKEISS